MPPKIGIPGRPGNPGPVIVGVTVSGGYIDGHLGEVDLVPRYPDRRNDLQTAETNDETEDRDCEQRPFESGSEPSG